ncbi:MAG: YggS family pyridoxal phosphate-dependent enzyme [Anaerolineales bacterium]|nr:YggS family pyridoxal phosphate-dependent enzyme [Anaerolineales bacterium]
MNESLISSIRERYQRVLGQIAAAAARRCPELVEGSARDAQAVRLVVVTKAQPLGIVRAAAAAGVRIFAENYAEEAVAKIAAFRVGAAQKNEFEVEWHMIGHVQSRKADLVAGNFSILHSLDSLKLAARLERFLGEYRVGAAHGKILPVLLEFNVSREESKFGWPAWDETRWPHLLPEVRQILQLPHLEVRGLMTMPPYFEDAELARPYFQRLRRLRDFLAAQFPQADWRELSMGTSLDFEVAVQEGATYVRVGQAILGSRPTK